jgi:hypothetical protein
VPGLLRQVEAAGEQSEEREIHRAVPGDERRREHGPALAQQRPRGVELGVVEHHQVVGLAARHERREDLGAEADAGEPGADLGLLHVVAGAERRLGEHARRRSRRRPGEDHVHHR